MRKRRLRAHLHLHYVEIPVPTPWAALSLGRLQLIFDPTLWRWGRYSYPPDWRKLPAVDGVVAPIMRARSFGPVHLHLFRWAS